MILSVLLSILGMSSEALEQTGALVVGGVLVVARVGYKWVKAKTDRVNFTKKKLDIAMLISERLTDMRADLKIDRLGIMEFSNGDKSVSGFPFLFVTMTYEKCEMNVASIKHLVNKVPASWYIDFNSYFTDTNTSYGYFYDDGRCSVQGGAEFINKEAAKMLHGFGIKSLWNFKIGKHISSGMLNIAFIDERKVFTEDEILAIMGDCRYIDNLFNQRPQ